jgi:hypothetical protein
MGRPAATLDDWLDWQQRLESQKASGAVHYREFYGNLGL